VAAFYMDKYPATNANYSTYLKATGYTPRDPYHWLRQWGGAAAGSHAPLVMAELGSDAPSALTPLGGAALAGLALPGVRSLATVRAAAALGLSCSSAPRAKLPIPRPSATQAPPSRPLRCARRLLPTSRWLRRAPTALALVCACPMCP